MLNQMRSRLAEQLKQEQRERVLAMTPAERLALTERLGREGRRPSRCFDERD